MYSKETLRNVNAVCTSLEIYLKEVKERIKILLSDGNNLAHPDIRAVHEKLLAFSHDGIYNTINSEGFRLLHEEKPPEEEKKKTDFTWPIGPSISPRPDPYPPISNEAIEFERRRREDEERRKVRDAVVRQAQQQDTRVVRYGDPVQVNGVHASVNQAIQSEEQEVVETTPNGSVSRQMTRQQRWFPNGDSGFAGGSSSVGGASDDIHPVMALTATSVELKATESPGKCSAHGCHDRGCGML